MKWTPDEYYKMIMKAREVTGIVGFVVSGKRTVGRDLLGAYVMAQDLKKGEPVGIMSKDKDDSIIQRYLSLIKRHGVEAEAEEVYSSNILADLFSESMGIKRNRFIGWKLKIKKQ